MTLLSPFTPAQLAPILLNTHWVLTYELSPIDMLGWFSYKTAERVVHYNVTKEDESTFSFYPRKQSWNEKDADHNWRVPTLTVTLKPDAVGTEVSILYRYNSFPHVFTACWVAGWLLVLLMAVLASDRDNGFGIVTGVLLALGGFALGIATLAAIQRNGSHIEQSMNLLLQDSLATPVAH